MQLFSPNPTAMFLSRGRGAQTSTPPAQDAFREVFQSRLQARLSPPNNLAKQNDRRASGLRGDPGPAAVQNRQKKRGLPGAPDAGEARRVPVVTAKKPHHEVKQTRTMPAGPAGGEGQASPQPLPNSKGGAAAQPPQALQDLIAFLQSQPDGRLTISPEQAPAVAAFLRSAGLPQEEVDGLLLNSGSPDITLSAAALTAAWERAQAQNPAADTVKGGGLSPANQGQKTQEIQQTSDYRALWERLSLPADMVPTLRLALARLGASPEILTQVEEEARGQGIPLVRIWQLLQTVKQGQAPNELSAQNPASPDAQFSQAAQLGDRPVTGGEMEEWRQVLLKAGLKPEVVEKLFGGTSPASQEELKTTLLAMAPAEEPLPTQTEPKPLYLPQNLRLRPFFWQTHTGGDQPQLNGDGLDDQGQNPKGELPSFATPGFPGENLGFPSFPAQLQGLSQGLTGPGAPLGEAGPAWRLLSPEVRESLWTQLQSGIITNLGQGENRVTLSLNPPELGQMQLTLHVSGQEVAVTAVAARPEVAEMATLGVQQLLQALAQQGLVLTQFQVRLQGQPEGQVSPGLAGSREKGGEPGGNPSTSSRRRPGEVDRFV